MKAAIIIPARLQSTRLADKLLLDRTGKPLICHTVDVAAKIRDLADGLFARVIVAADATAIVDVVKHYARDRGMGIEAVMTRPDHQSGSDRIAEVARSLPGDIDAVLNLQGDEPELPPDSALSLAAFYQQTMPDIATMVYPVSLAKDRDNPALVKAVLAADGQALYFSRADIPYRRDDGPFAPPSYGHVGIYLYRRSSLERFVSLPQGRLEQTEKLEQLRALENGMRITALVLDARPPKGIDTAEDYDEFVGRMVLK